MVARAANGRTKRRPSASRKPRREGSAKLARRLAEVQALRKHTSQIGQAPTPELRKRLRQRMAEVGKEPGYKLAEGFRRLSFGG